MATRPDWDDYFIHIAIAVARRADCTRRKVGAVVVRDHRIVSTGYNGAPAGSPGCLSGACPRGMHYPVPKYHVPDVAATFCAEQQEGRRPHSTGCFCAVYVDRCACGSDLPCPFSTPPGAPYSNCIAVHAEANALLYADYDKCKGAVMYLTDKPCSDCMKLIRGAGIAEVIWPGGSQVV